MEGFFWEAAHIIPHKNFKKEQPRGGLSSSVLPAASTGATPSPGSLPCAHAEHTLNYGDLNPNFINKKWRQQELEGVQRRRLTHYSQDLRRSSIKRDREIKPIDCHVQNNRATSGHRKAKAFPGMPQLQDKFSAHFNSLSVPWMLYCRYRHRLPRYLFIATQFILYIYIARFTTQFTKRLVNFWQYITA